MSWRRDPLARDRADLRRMRLQREREAMTGDQIEAVMRQIIRRQLDIAEPIGIEDFTRANLPKAEAEARFRKCLAKVQAEITGTLQP